MSNKIDKNMLELFYEFPDRTFTIREISKLTKIPRATAYNYLVNLKKENLINDQNKPVNSLLFKTMKVDFFIENIVSSGLIEEIINKLNPSCIILFGSIRKGESNNESDIDLFVESSLYKDLNLREFEKTLKHKIQLFVKPSINNLSDELLNNVVNGIKIYGSFKLK